MDGLSVPLAYLTALVHPNGYLDLLTTPFLVAYHIRHCLLARAEVSHDQRASSVCPSP
ncbi:MAG: hypothetical protein H5T71_08065 [Chloroflexi bacterium]|nr:hypothetical protein [Chloroflexota bacterium]